MMHKLFIIAFLFVPLFCQSSQKHRSISSSIYLKVIKEVFSFDKTLIKDGVKGILKISFSDCLYHIGPITMSKRQSIDYGCQIAWISYHNGIKKIPYQFIKYLTIDFFYKNVRAAFSLFNIDFYPDMIKKKFFLYMVLRFYVTLMGKRLLEKVIDAYFEQEQVESDYLYNADPDAHE